MVPLSYVRQGTAQGMTRLKKDATKVSQADAEAVSY